MNRNGPSTADVGVGGAPVAELATELRDRRAELEPAMLARVRGVAGAPVPDAEYIDGLRSAVSVAVTYAISALDSPQGHPPAVPPQLPAQARLAARNGVPLETVLRRYVAGHALLGDFAIHLAESAGLPLSGVAVRRLWREQAAVLDRVLAAVSLDYRDEAEARGRGAERRRAERVRDLLGGEPVDTAVLGYDFRAWNTAAVASGPDAPRLVKELAAAHGCRLLAVRSEGEVLWAWLGTEGELDAQALLHTARALAPAGANLALGECGRGVEGWRLSHRQAHSAHAVALRDGAGVVCYADVALLAAALRDETLSDTLHKTYLGPLGPEGEGGAALRETLVAYFAADRNVSSAAASLGVSRQTVSNRLQAAEQRLGRTIASCAAELETALLLRELAD